MKCPKCKHVFKDPAKVKGGKSSRRTISKEQQDKMQAARRLNQPIKGGNKPPPRKP